MSQSPILKTLGDCNTKTTEFKFLPKITDVSRIKQSFGLVKISRNYKTTYVEKNLGEKGPQMGPQSFEFQRV